MHEKTFTFTHDNRKKTAIPLAPDSVSISRGMFQGGKVPGYLVTGDGVSPWYWEGIQTIHGMRCIYTETANLHPLSMLFSTNLSAASRTDLYLMLLTRLDQAVRELKLPWFAKGFPLCSIWLIPGSGILILPEPIAEVMMNSVPESRRYALRQEWIHPRAPAGQEWLYQMITLFYAAVTNVSPFADERIREAGYDPLPLWSLRPSVSDDFSSGMMSWIKLEEPLPDAAQLAERIREEKPRISAAAPSVRYETAESCRQQHQHKIEKRARRRIFLRKHGVKLGLAAAAAVIVGAMAVNWIIEAAKPPIHEGLEPIEVVTLFYDLQDELRLEAYQQLMTSTAENIRENQLVYMHVSNAMRQAYGGGDFLPAKQWIADGRPVLPPATAVYGITNLDIEQIGELEFTAEFILWYPDSPPDGVTEPEHALVTGIQFVEQLQLEDHGSYYMISRISVLAQEPVNE